MPSRSRVFDKPRGVETTVVLSDIHLPYHNVNALSAVKDFLDDVRPDRLVLDGDIVDLYEVSRHNEGSVLLLRDKDITRTWNVADHEIGELCDAAGRGCREKRFVRGNHEDRLRRWLQDGDHAVFANEPAFNIATRLHLPERGIVMGPELYPNDGIMVGKLWIYHGQYCGKYHARTHLDKFRHSVMYGHTHTPQTHHVATLKGQQAAYGLGWLGDWDSEAVDYADKVNSWVHGFGVVHTWPDGSYTAQQINFWRGCFVYGGRVYGRRTK